MNGSELALHASLLACVVGAGLLVRRYDLYEREPWWMLLLAAVAGYGAMAAMGVLEPATLDRFGPAPRPNAIVAIVAASHEEAARFVVVLLLALLIPRQVNDPMDGLVYGSLVGLGMALEESHFFVNLWHSPGPLPPASELVRFCGHLVMGGIAAAGVAPLALRMRGALPRALAALAIAVALHFTWDLLAFNAVGRERMGAALTLGAILTMLAGFVAWGAIAVGLSSASRARFAPDDPRRLHRRGRTSSRPPSPPPASG